MASAADLAEQVNVRNRDRGMQVALIGTGDIASGLASLFLRHGHSVALGTRQPERPNRLAAALALEAVSYSRAAESADLVCFCVPWQHAEPVAAELASSVTGKILLDPSNPETPDGRNLLIGHSISGAEILAQRAPGAQVVKAFNYVYADLLRDDEALTTLAPSIFLCGDQTAAKEVVAWLITSCGLEPIDCGPLSAARYLEPLALLMVQLVRNQGWPSTGVAMHLQHK